MNITYFDYAATTPVCPEAIAALTEELGQFGNPSSRHEFGRQAALRVKANRETVAKALGCAPGEVYFTASGTEGNNWAIRKGVEINRRRGKHIITTAIEHAAVLETCRDLAGQGYEITYLKPDRQGHISADDLRAALRPDTVLVSMMLVNNETGALLPVAECVKAVKAFDRNILFHCDAVQGFLKVPFAVASMGCDMVTVSGHKIGAPKGIGALYISPKLHPIQPMIRGGGQERNMRSGTEGTAQIAAFAAACKVGHEQLQDHIDYLTDLKAYTLEKLRATVPGLVVVSEGDAPHICAISLPGRPSQVVVRYLSDKGVCLSSGSACHKGKASHVYAAMNLSKPTRDGMLRVSFGPSNTREDIDALAEALLSATRELVAAVK